MSAADPGIPEGQARRRRRGPFSSLTGRVLAVNIVALAVLVGGILYLDEFRASLIVARTNALLNQGEIIAGALGLAASSGPEALGLDVDTASLLLRRLTDTLNTRARLLESDGQLIADTNALRLSTQVSRVELPPPDSGPGVFEFLYDLVEPILPVLRQRPLYVEYPPQRTAEYPEVVLALGGNTSVVERVTAEGVPYLSVCVPVVRFRKVLGALMLSVEARDIDLAIRTERIAILEVFGVAFAVTIALSLFLSSTIARPVRQLAAAADKVRDGRGARVAVPDFSRRRDEIGDLSVALRDMTEALYGRIDAIASFAADVAHELKNPLTSIRSAVETFERTDRPDIRSRLARIIGEDVRRLDRLISEISDASRLDAELARDERHVVDLGALLAALVHAYADVKRPGQPHFTFRPPAEPIQVEGSADRLGQVVRNLIDNALSFSPPEGTVAVALNGDRDTAELTVDDDGPGIPPEALERIFERFYTERSAESFGSHSGLGLAIARQIITAHNGTIRAENRHAEAGPPAGARLIITLPRVAPR